MVLVVPKLNDSVKSELLKYLAKCQMDEQVDIVYVCVIMQYVSIDQYVSTRYMCDVSFPCLQPGIRTNTTICLGRIACHLNPSVS